MEATSLKTLSRCVPLVSLPSLSEGYLLPPDQRLLGLNAQFGYLPHRPEYPGALHQAGNPFVGDAGNNSFNSQPCYIFKIPDYKGARLYMGDRCNGGGPDSQYVFLPVMITEDGNMKLHRYKEWTLSMFTPIQWGYLVSVATSCPNR